MTEMTDTNDTLNPNDFTPKNLPQGLKVLTILTFIGCAFGIIFTLLTPWLMRFSKSMMDKASTSDLTPKQAADIEKSKHVMELTQANMIPLMLVGVVGIVLCFIGALMMRKLKKDGFWLYAAGEILPLIGSLAIMGMAQFTGVTSYFMFVIPVLFLILYARQRKYLIN